jgi:hypothetical protein
MRQIVSASAAGGRNSRSETARHFAHIFVLLTALRFCGLSMGMQHAESTVVLTIHERTELAALRARARGILRASVLVGVSRDTYERAAGGLGIRRGSAALVRAALVRLAERRVQP